MTRLNQWYTDEEFWDTFGSLMFGEGQFTEAAEQLPDLLGLAGIEPVEVLDLGCGPGRHALPLARAGYRVRAVDTSARLLAELDRRAAEADLEVRCEQADMRKYRDPEAFDLVVVMWTSFGYFEDEVDHRRVLDNIRVSLRPGGRVLLDLVGLEYLCRNLEPVHLTEYEDGRILVERPVLTDNLSRLENQWLLIAGDRVHRTEFSHRVWSAGEITRLVEEAGLDLVAIYGGYGGEDYDLEAERMIVVAEKPAQIAIA